MQCNGQARFGLVQSERVEVGDVKEAGQRGVVWAVKWGGEGRQPNGFGALLTLNSRELPEVYRLNFQK